MTFLTAEDLPEDTTLRCEVCIVGAGAAGLTIASQLDRPGRDIILLEAGGLTRDLAVEAETFSLRHSGLAHRDDIDARGRLFGGSTSLWFGRIARPDPIDFQSRAWVPNSGWPIDLDELNPWFDAATELLAVEPASMLDIENWPSNPTIDAFSASDKLGVKPFLWSGAPDMGKTSRPDLQRSLNVRVITHATATQFMGPDTANIETVELVGPSGTRFRVQADSFVLAAGGFENPRLLLASTASQPAGLGNQNDNVGRYYLDHPRCEGLATVDLSSLDATQNAALRFLDEKVDSPFGEVQLSVVFSEEEQRNQGLLNHSLHGYILTEIHQLPGFDALKRIQSRIQRDVASESAPILTDIAALIKSAPGLAKLAAARGRGLDPAPQELVVVDQLEQIPNRSTRVTLIPHTTDRFGLPLLDVAWTVDDSTHDSLRHMHQLFDASLKSIGVTTFKSQILDRSDDTPAYLDMKHPSGTTRMSASPTNGVVDSDCRVHGVNNLYVAGSSTFPTAGHFNPTLTIVALAARLAHHLGRMLV